MLFRSRRRGPSPSAETVSLSPDGARALDRLRGWRTERARADGVPAYVVAPNALLEALAAAAPTDPDQLAEVQGMGPKRVERYGEAILAALREPGGADA